VVVLQKLGQAWKIVFVLTGLTHRHPLHEPQVPIQMASLPIRHYPAVCQVVLALPTQLPQLRRNDAGEGSRR